MDENVFPVFPGNLTTLKMSDLNTKTVKKSLKNSFNFFKTLPNYVSGPSYQVFKSISIKKTQVPHTRSIKYQVSVFIKFIFQNISKLINNSASHK